MFSTHRISTRRSFFNQLCSRLPDDMGRIVELKALVEPLDLLPWEWWGCALEAASTALGRGGLKQLMRRLELSIKTCRNWESLRIHARSSSAALTRTAILQQERPARFMRRHARLVERVARELLIHRTEGNERVTKVGREAWARRETYITQALRRESFREQRLANLHRNKESASLARFWARTDGETGALAWAVRDLGWHAREFFINPPAAMMTYFQNGDINEGWINAGRPDARESYRFLMGVLEATLKAAEKRGIKPVGFRCIESNQGGAAHMNLMSAFCSGEDGDTFTELLWSKYYSVMRKKYAACMPPSVLQRGGFGVREPAISTPIVSREVSPGELVQQVNYARKGCTLANADRLFCKLHGLRQFDVIGVRDAEKWDFFRSLNPALMQSESVPARVRGLYAAAMRGDYRAWLRLTDRRTPEHLRGSFNDGQILECLSLEFDLNQRVLLIRFSALPSMQIRIDRGGLSIVNLTRSVGRPKRYEFSFASRSSQALLAARSAAGGKPSS